MEEFFQRIKTESCAFLSMNWDTVVEELVEDKQKINNIEYGCSAVAAKFRGAKIIELESNLLSTKYITVLKPHGSINWMYCDICSRLYWFPASDTLKISSRLFKARDRAVVKRITRKECPKPSEPGSCPRFEGRGLGTRFATFSYRKALEFPMHHATWAYAEELLQKAKTWIFVGYSLPPADYQFKYLLKRVQLSRARNSPEILVVTKEPPGAQTIENYKRFFGFTSVPDSNTLTGGMDGDALKKLESVGALR
jgi:hypothetical protein